MNKTIVSLKSINKLQTHKGRSEQKKFIVEGMRALKAASENNKKPLIVYVIEKQYAQVAQFISPKKIHIISIANMKKISSASTPSGILAVFPISQKKILSPLHPTLICDGISDPGNLGTLIRTTAAMGKKSIILIDGVDPYNPKVIQASAGAWSQLDIFQITWDECKDIIHKQKSLLCALVPKNGTSPNELNLKKSFLVIGSEAHGLDRKHIQDCDQFLTLAMPGKTESLNAAIAGSIALYLSVTQI